ncbi:MAG: peptidoglycan bridge formation glycyltransferase FemA/FemB family protein [Patescibacteria group bacterium]
MQVTEIKTQAKWDEWMQSIPHTPFTQAWDWGVFQMSQGYQVLRLAVGQPEARPVMLVQLALVPLKFGYTFALSPLGPQVTDPTGIDLATKTLVNFLQQKSFGKIVFWRAEPSLRLPGAWKKVADRQPSRTLLLDLTKTEEDLLAGMHSKTRYNIKLAERKGMTVRFGRSSKEMDAFIHCIKETYARHEIKSFPESYYRTQLATIPWEQVGLAEYEGKVVATNLLSHFGDTFTYVHGGSLSAHKELMAPQLLQWRSIQEAKKLGAKWYDFYGIAPEGAVNHPWAGISRFKLGFGGVAVERPGTFELPFKSIPYTLFTSLKRLRF